MFEFDPAKSAANKAKHGIDFEEAQALWRGGNVVMLPSRYPHEPRSLAIGEIGSQLWTAIVTHRDENIRLISVRRSRQEEADVYQEYSRRRD